MKNSQKFVNIVPRRKVLFEKYDRKVAIEEYFVGSLDGCKIETNTFYKKSLFFVKNEVSLFQINRVKINVDFSGIFYFNKPFWDFFKLVNHTLGMTDKSVNNDTEFLCLLIKQVLAYENVFPSFASNSYNIITNNNKKSF